LSDEEVSEKQVAFNIGIGLELLMDNGQLLESPPRDTNLPSNPTTAIPSENLTPRESSSVDLAKKTSLKGSVDENAIIEDNIVEESELATYNN
jgi:hypothetical protein